MAINVPSDKARAVVDAMEPDMVTVLATKSDLAAMQLLLKQDLSAVHTELKHDIGALRTEARQDFAGLRQEFDGLRLSTKLELELLRSSMTIRLGSMLVVGLSLLLAALKLT